VPSTVICFENSVVNGQSASVVRFENQTIFVKLSTGKVVPIYKVCTADGRAVYPLMLRYALTIATVQGQTLNNVLIYLDTCEQSWNGRKVSVVCSSLTCIKDG